MSHSTTTVIYDEMKQPADYSPFHVKEFETLSQNSGNRFANDAIDGCLISYAHECFKTKMKLTASKGAANWWREIDTPLDELKAQLWLHADKGDMVDVMIVAAMIHARECNAWMEEQS